MKKHIPSIARILLGLMFTASFIAGMMGKIPPPKGESALAFMTTLADSGLLSFIKVIELVCGLALLSGFFVPLALLVLAPIIVVITFYHLLLDPSGMAVGFVMTALWLTAGSAYRTIFLSLLHAKQPAN
ncbi:MAG TPA: DoxX family membrane protein [Myxococcales bacterium]|nr:DoxX family membrane protein [Myxococcales bacterium]